jgi:alkylresorcinol/alkylpyrone synthase
VVATATANPPFTIDSEETKYYLRRVFGDAYPELDRADRMVDHTGTARRALALPIEQLLQERTIEETMAIYEDTVRELGVRVSLQALASAGLAPTDVDMVIAVSCTGYTIPSLAVHLAFDLGLRPGVRRLPITELGCSGGAAGLALASEYARARPGQVVLLVAVELCSLCFQLHEMDWQNVVAATLFGDGAAAAVVTDEALGAGPMILDHHSHLFPDTLDYMRFNLTSSGFQLVMSPQIPRIVQHEYRGLLESYLRRHELAPENLDFYVLHPGGAKILRHFARHVGVPHQWIQPAADVLRDHGNMSSTTVLFVLDRIMRQRPPQPGALGVMGGFGPGFGAELLLLQWTDTSTRVGQVSAPRD